MSDPTLKISERRFEKKLQRWTMSNYVVTTAIALFFVLRFWELFSSNEDSSVAQVEASLFAQPIRGLARVLESHDRFIERHPIRRLDYDEVQGSQQERHQVWREVLLRLEDAQWKLIVQRAEQSQDIRLALDRFSAMIDVPLSERLDQSGLKGKVNVQLHARMMHEFGDSKLFEFSYFPHAHSIPIAEIYPSDEVSQINATLSAARDILTVIQEETSK